MLHVQNRELVLPGQLLAEGKYRLLGGTFQEDNRVYSSVVGLADLRGQEIRVIPLQGRYIPKQGDLVLGKVVDLHLSGWIVDLNSPYVGNLFAQDFLRKPVDPAREDLSKYLKVGDLVMARVKEVDELARVRLEASGRELGKISGGRLMEITPAKVPRVIGKRGSMIATIQETSGCKLKVGQNGRLVIWGKNPRMVRAVVEILLKIEREAHLSGLTDRVRLALEKARSKEG